MTTIPDCVSTLELSKLLIAKALKRIEAENNSQNASQEREEQSEESN